MSCDRCVIAMLPGCYRIRTVILCLEHVYAFSSFSSTLRYPECVNKDIQRDAGTVVSILNDLYEQKHYDSYSQEELAEKTGLAHQELRKALDTLLSAGWIEKAHQTLSGYEVRLTLFGKTEVDRQTNNRRN